MIFHWDTDSYRVREGGEKPIAAVLINGRSDFLIRRPTKSRLLCRLWDLIALIDLHVNPKQRGSLAVWKDPVAFLPTWLEARMRDEEEERLLQEELHYSRWKV